MVSYKTLSIAILPVVSVLLYYLCQQGDDYIKQSIEINVDSETVAKFWGDLSNIQKIHSIMIEQETLSEYKSVQLIDGKKYTILISDLRVVEEVFEGLGTTEVFLKRRKYRTSKGIYHEYIVENSFCMMNIVFCMKDKDHKTLVEETTLIRMPKILFPFMKFMKWHITKLHLRLMEKIKSTLEKDMT